MVSEKAEVVVFIPHPDDAEIGFGGTAARWIREGKNIIYVLCTNGDKGTSDPEIKPEQLAKIREEEQLAAAKILGIREVIFLRHPDQGLEDTSEFRKELVRVIRRYQPETVVTVDPYRPYISHRDHRITGRVVLDAVFPYARDLYAYPDLIEEGLQPHKVKEVLLWSSDGPNYCSDITDTFDLKLAALFCHKSQIGHDNPERKERMRERASAQAEGEEFELAEAFYRIEISR
ncbi:MAG: PIG-L deacetylase family protein [Dehalococcoidales bacterium]|nr:PIG-L deacetylase family protein [Dehalococcoidales bacterium]